VRAADFMSNGFADIVQERAGLGRFDVGFQFRRDDPSEMRGLDACGRTG
jgi:hypothetical protein